jgi:hypothetical protein
VFLEIFYAFFPVNPIPRTCVEQAQNGSRHLLGQNPASYIIMKTDYSPISCLFSSFADSLPV